MSDFSEMMEQVAKRLIREIEDYAYKHGVTLEEAILASKININGRSIPTPVSPSSTSEGFI